MKLLRYFAAAAALAVMAPVADAGDKGCNSCGHSKLSGLFSGLRGHGGGHPVPPPSTLFGGHNKLPAYQAAPWYMYWPYDGHFLTPAPIQGAFYGPPVTGNFPVNPYFPQPMGGHGHHHLPPVTMPGK